MEETMVVETGQRVGLREMLETRADLRVVEGKGGCVAEPLRQLELMLVEGRVLADAVDVERAFERAACDQRHGDQRLRLDRCAGNVHDARIEVRAVRPDGLSVLDRPAGDPLAEARAVLHDLVRVGLRACEQRDELAAFLVDLVDVQRLIGHQVAQRLGDPVEQRVEALLGEDVVEDLGQTPVGLDERFGPTAAGRNRATREGRLGSCGPHHHSSVHRRSEARP